jgi:uncharacterized alkaline shock family protein YloU
VNPSASARVHTEEGGVAVDLAFVLQSDVELPTTVDQVTSTVSAALARRYGASMTGKPHIRVRYAQEPEDQPRQATAVPTS